MTDPIRERARHQVQRIKGFYIHGAVYVLVNTILGVVNWTRGPEDLWFHWVALGWGAGVALHAFLVYGGKIGRNWEERKIEKLVQEDKKR